MTVRLTIANSFTVGGKTFAGQTTVDDEGALIREDLIPAAKTGTLAVRTSNSVGTLTMAGGHGITTGARLDLYWSGGMRRGIVVGTVATNSVPITGGSGDNLPLATTPITAMVPVSHSFVMTGSNVSGLAMYSEAIGQMVFAAVDATEIYAQEFETAGQAYGWYIATGVANPLTGGAITQVYFSHGDSTQSRTMRTAVTYD